MDVLTQISTMFADSAAVSGLAGISAKAALVLLTALCASVALKRASASTRHQVWALALVAVLALPVLTVALPSWDLPVLPAAVAPASVAPQAPATASPRNSSEPRVSAPTSAPGLADGNASASQPADNGASLASYLPTSPAGIALAIWALGATFFMVRLMASSTAAWWIVRRADRVKDGALLEHVAEVRDELGIRNPVELVQSDNISMPMAWGILRPAVLLPSAASDWSRQRQRIVLLHEMAHLKRRDCQTLLLARVVTALHWFNPLAWTATRRLHAERERACDDLVLSTGTRGPDYAEHLLEIARGMRSGSPRWATVAMARPSELEGRLLAILDPARKRERVTGWATLAGMLAFGVLVLPLAAAQPSAAAQSAQSRDEVRRVAEKTTSQLERQIDFQVDRQVEAMLEGGLPAGLESGIAEGAAQALGQSLAGSLAASAQDDGSAQNPAVMQAFMTALQDEDDEIREAAAHALGNLESPEAVAALSDIVRNDSSADVRESAAWALGMIESDAGVEALTVAMTDADADVRTQAAWALGMIEDVSAVPGLSTGLNDSDADVREQSAWALGMIESADSVAALITVLDDEDEDVRSQAAWALGMIESAAAVDGLSAMVRNDASAEVRSQAAWALGMIEDEGALDALLDAVTDEDLEVRKQALWAVGQISG